MRHLDLFSGIGGFALAASRVWGNKHEIVGFCEIDEFCQKVLKKHWPNAPIITNIKKMWFNPLSNRLMNGKKYVRKCKTINLLTGGFPCQPYSVAGKQKGAKDDRAIWPEMLRIIKEAKPTWVVAENVPGIINMELDKVLSDLENEGYATETFNIPACGVDAWHRRYRIWIVAHSHNAAPKRQQQYGGKVLSFSKSKRFSLGSYNAADSNGIRSQRGKLWDTACRTKGVEIFAPESLLLGNGGETVWQSEPTMGRMANGVSNRVDRLRSLGNAIVPQVAEVIFMMIKQYEAQEARRDIKQNEN